MGHNLQSIMDIYDIIRHWQRGASISAIAPSLGFARHLSLFLEPAPTMPLIPETSLSFANNQGAEIRLRF